jgi:hypothetical protein
MKHDQGMHPLAADETNAIQRIFSSLSATWRIAGAIGLGSLIVLLSVLFFLRSTVPAITTYLARLEFKFPGVESGRYPNGEPFSLNEIIEPAVISPIYEKFKLDQFKVDRDEFFNAFSIRPYVPQEAEIAERFQQQLADRKLTVTERERIEARLKSLLDQGSRGGAEIAMTLRRNFDISSELGRSIVQAIPQAWSQYQIEKKGVLRLSGLTVSDVGVSAGAFDSVSLPRAILMLSQAADQFRGRLTEASRIGGIQTLVEPSSRKSLRDLENNFRDLEIFHVNPLRAALSFYQFSEGLEDTRLLIQQRIRELQADERYNSGIATALTATTSQFVQSIVALKGRSEGRRASSDQGNTQLGGTTTIPQLSESFLDKMVDLSTRGRESDENMQRYIAEINSRQLATAEKLVNVQTEQQKWQHILEELSANDHATSLDDGIRSKLKLELQSTAAEVNSQWLTLNRLQAEFAANRLSHTARLYNLFLTRPDIVRYDPFFNRTVISMGVAAAWLLFVIIWIVRAMLFFNRTQRVA